MSTELRVKFKQDFVKEELKVADILDEEEEEKKVNDNDKDAEIALLFEEERSMTIKEDDKDTVTLTRDENYPCDVYSYFEVTLKEVDVITQTFACGIEMHIFWQDYNFPNLFPDYNTREFTLDEVSLPFKINHLLENKVELSVEALTFKYLEETNTIYCYMLIECVLTERMEMHRFPVDRQFLNIHFNAYTKEGNWNWILDYVDWVPKEFHKQPGVKMLSSITEYELLPLWVDFSSAPFSIRLRIDRKPAYYMGSIVLPNFLIIVSCLATFAISPDDPGSRLGVNFTLLFSAVAFRSIVSTMLPKLSYLTIMDYYLNFGFIALVVLIAENAIVGISFASVAQTSIDGVFAGSFGLLWILIHTIAAIVVVNKKAFRISWDVMNDIDKAKDQEIAFILASKAKTKARQMTEYSKKLWEIYKSKGALERAKLHQKAIVEVEENHKGPTAPTAISLSTSSSFIRSGTALNDVDPATVYMSAVTHTLHEKPSNIAQNTPSSDPDDQSNQLPKNMTTSILLNSNSQLPETKK